MNNEVAVKEWTTSKEISTDKQIKNGSLKSVISTPLGYSSEIIIM